MVILPTFSILLDEYIVYTYWISVITEKKSFIIFDLETVVKKRNIF